MHLAGCNYNLFLRLYYNTVKSLYQNRSDADLARYDNISNKYKVNHLLEKTSTAISKR